MQSRKVNLNDDIKIEITSEKHPDDVNFHIALIHDYEIVNTKTFEYTSYSF